MLIRRVLLLLKPFDADAQWRARLKMFNVKRHLDGRCRNHKAAVTFCEDILRRRSIQCETVLRHNLSQLIRHVDLVITVGGDGTILQASHFMDDSVPALGVNSDPTCLEEVRQFKDEFDATRSSGYLCAATTGSLETILDEIIKDQRVLSKLSRLSVCLNERVLSTYALNDVLIAHPCPAAVSRFSFKVRGEHQITFPLTHCRSSGLRIATAAGSTAAMLSAGGYRMPILSEDLQYMVREPIINETANSCLMHGIVKPGETLHVTWYSAGVIYIDGSHVFHSLQYGDTVELSSKAPFLNMYLPHHLST